MDNTATSTIYISTDNYDGTDTSQSNIITFRYTTTSTRGTFRELKDVIMWIHVIQMREDLRRMWLFSLYSKVIIKHINNYILTFRNYRILRCNRRGIGLRIKKDR
jgi:hypothetical protein